MITENLSRGTLQLEVPWPAGTRASAAGGHNEGLTVAVPTSKHLRVLAFAQALKLQRPSALELEGKQEDTNQTRLGAAAGGQAGGPAPGRPRPGCRLSGYLETDDLAAVQVAPSYRVGHGRWHTGKE